MQQRISDLYLNLVILMTVLATACYTSQVLAKENAPSFYANFEQVDLIDQNGKPFVFEAQQGKLMLLNFIFTKCSAVCPVQTKQLASIKKSLPLTVRHKVVFVSVSLDPLGDTPKVLTQFINRMRIDDAGWYFLTGKLGAVAKIVDRLKLFGTASNAKDVNKPDDHTTALWLVDQRGKLMMRYRGVPVDEKRVARELQQLSELNK